MHLCLSGKRGGTNLHPITLVLVKFAVVYTAGSTTQISGCHDPFETESSLTKNIFSRRMNPSPIFHFLGVDSPTVYGSCCGSRLSNIGHTGFIAVNLQPSSPDRT